MEDNEVAKALYKLQKEKKCFVVLDDIWSTTTWDCLKFAFPETGSNSKVLFTTRIRDVAVHADPRSIVHRPDYLNPDESWELLNKKTHFPEYETESEDDKEKKRLARQMLNCCGGLPLAITVLGGLLSSKQTVNEWEMLHNNIKTYIGKGKINEQEYYSDNAGLSWVLGLSYDELPYYLKPCFLHLAYFPEDFEIRAKELCRIWMAEGFVSGEDAAYECLSELVERCIVQVAELGSTGRIKTCRIHDLMRDLCLSKAQEENFLRLVDPRNHEATGTSSSSSGSGRATSKVRRLAIYLNNNSADELLSLIMKKDVCVRSLVCFNPEPDTSYEQLMKPLLKRFHLLRVLKLENLTARTHDGKLPEEIGNLIHLRLFSLKDSYVEKLPSSIGNLRCLQTLDLRFKTLYYQKRLQFSEIPCVISKLEQLRHLYLPRHYFTRGHLKRSFFSVGHSESLLRLDNLNNLQTVVNISAKYYYYLDMLANLTNLTKLKVFLGWSSFRRSTGIKLKKLRSLAIYPEHVEVEHVVTEDNQITRRGPRSLDVHLLILDCPQICKLHLQVPMEDLPNSNEFSSKLIKLTLVGTCFKDDPMKTLEKLLSLRILVLDHNAFTGSYMICSSKGFPRLESLSICYLNEFREWKVEEGALPSLGRLHIVNCLKLRTMPDGLRHLITLKEIVIQHMFREFKRRVEQGGVDFDKVQHVPSLVFMNTLEF